MSALNVDTYASATKPKTKEQKVISNLYIHASQNKLAFVYLEPAEHPSMANTYIVQTPLKWITATFYASTMEQALEICDSIETLANYGMDNN